MIDVSNFNAADAASVNLSQVIAFIATYGLILSIVSLVTIIWLWIIFKKAGKKGWLSIIPIANVWVYLQIVGLPGWLCLIPIANFVALVFAAFKLPGKFGKSGILGLLILFVPVIGYGIIALGKQKEEVTTPELVSPAEPASTPVMAEATETAPDLMAAPTENVNNENINVVEEEKINAVEAPALTIPEESTLEPEPMVVAPEVQTIPEANVVSAFDMPVPAQPEVPVQVESPAPVETLEQTIITQPVEMPVQAETETPVAPLPVENLEVMEPFTPTETIDSLETTFEMPKIANEVINSDITETKKCPSCGHENEYSSKVCAICGSNLE